MDTDWIESGKAYVNHYRVLELFKELTTALIADQPDDPYAFITNTLTTLRREATRTDTTIIVRSPPSTRSHGDNTRHAASFTNPLHNSNNQQHQPLQQPPTTHCTTTINNTNNYNNN